MKIYEKKVPFKQVRDMEEAGTVERITILEQNVNILAGILTKLIAEVESLRAYKPSQVIVQKGGIQTVKRTNTGRVINLNPESGYVPPAPDLKTGETDRKIITNADELIKKSLGDVPNRTHGGGTDTTPGFVSPAEKETFESDENIANLTNVFILNDEQKRKVSEQQAAMVQKMSK